VRIAEEELAASGRLAHEYRFGVQVQERHQDEGRAVRVPPDQREKMTFPVDEIARDDLVDERQVHATIPAAVVSDIQNEVVELVGDCRAPFLYQGKNASIRIFTNATCPIAKIIQYS
jgi:hypothetical protein